MIPGLGSVIAEAARVARASPAVTSLVLILAFLVPASALAVAGRNVAGQVAVLARLDDAGSRLLTVVADPGGTGLPVAAADRIASLEGVAWVLGLGPSHDVRAGAGPVPMRAVRSIRAPVALGGDGGTGALVSSVSARRLGLGGAFGWLDPANESIVGWFRADYPVGALNAFVVVRAAGDEQLERVIVAVSDAGWAEQTAAHLHDLIGGRAGTSASVEWNQDLLAARVAVQDEVARRDRMLVVGLLSVAAVLAGIVVFTWTLAAQRDFGRRRALGASRAQLVALVVVVTALPAVCGASLGSLAGWAYLSAQAGAVSDPRFVLAVGLMSVLVCSGAAVAPAVVSACRDPLRVLRLP